MLRTSRGNVLLTALFIAIFLFFLSTALVSMNRQDILYTLSNNQRLQAQAAARGGLDYVVQVMRTVPQWEAQSSNFHGTMKDGATWKAVVSAMADPSGLPYLQQVTVDGQQGAISETLTEVFEELKMASTLDSGQTALMFSYAWVPGAPVAVPPTLAMLDGTFHWTLLGASPLQTPIETNTPWLVANNGPLFTQTGALPTPTPAVLYDWRPTSDADNILWPGTQQGITVAGTNLDEHVAYLTFTQNQATWNTIPVPPDSLGAYRGSLIDGQLNGQPQTKTVSDATHTVTYYSSLFQGPVKDWYGLRGPAVAAAGTTVICHAVHYFYLGEQFQNHVSVVRGKIVSSPYQVAAQTLQMPAVLTYDVHSQQWAVVVDCMQFGGSRQSAPNPYQGPQPNLNSLGWLGGLPYAYSSDGQYILKGSKNAWATYSTSPSPRASLGLYGASQLLIHQPNGQSDDGLPQVTLGQLTPETQLSFEQTETTGDQYATSSGSSSWKPVMLRPPLTMHLSMLADCLAQTPAFTVTVQGANCVAQLNGELWSWVRVRRHWIFDDTAQYLTPFSAFLPIGQTGSDWNAIDTMALAHWDGQGWQLWPGGITQQIQVEPDSFAINDYDVTIGGTLYTLDTQHLATGVYSASTPPVRRYAPIPEQP